MTQRTVNPRQLEVLIWIVDGSPEGVMTDTTHKTTAVALQGRRLVKVSKKGGVWKAEPTEAGRYFVKHGSYPPGHWSASAVLTRAPVPAALEETTKPREPKCDRIVTGLRPVDQMIADLLDAGGELTVMVDADRQGYWEGLASSATRHNKVPDGKLLTVRRGESWGDRIIRLEDPPAWMSVVLAPIPVREQIRSPHPAVKALRDDRGRLPLKRRTRTRALRILDALARAAATRGYDVREPKSESGYGHAKGLLEITINQHSNVVDLDELNDRVPHEPTVAELRAKERFSWTRIPDHDYVPSGRLRLSLLREVAVRQDTFTDTKTIKLEDRLPVVLQELELRAAAAEEREQRLEAERRERQRRWEHVRDEAIVEAREDHLAKVLLGEVERYHQARQVGVYVAAMDAEIAALPDGETKEAAAEWLAWARGYQAQIDPLNRQLGVPADPDFTPDTLKPFMRGLSPYGASGW